MARQRRRGLDTCGHCGASFRAGRPACPECGSDHETGWSDEADPGRTGSVVPEAFTDEDYDDVLRDLPGGPKPESPPWDTRRAVVIAIGLALLAWAAYSIVRFGRWL